MKSFSKAKRHMRRVFTLATFIVMVASSGIIIAMQFPIMSADFIDADEFESFWQFTVLIFAGATWIIGSLLAFLAGRLILQPINQLLDGMEKLSSGKYGTRIYLGGSKGLQVVADGFNSLASELEHTEIVRADFINDFSHEFKTPLASVKGLAALMKSGRVTPEKQKEYLSIIEEETDRLAMMTTNILNLSKIQNQQIVIDKTFYNISEQIRGCLVIFEKRWLERGLSVSADMGEHFIYASEDLLRLVLINLIDNAVKFANEGSEIEIFASDDGKDISITITNTGEVIPDDVLKSIFHKFYRADSSLSRPGNGIGLYIVKSIIELHGGEISASSVDGKTSFCAVLPKE